MCVCIYIYTPGVSNFIATDALSTTKEIDSVEIELPVVVRATLQSSRETERTRNASRSEASVRDDDFLRVWDIPFVEQREKQVSFPIFRSVRLHVIEERRIMITTVEQQRGYFSARCASN